MIVTLKSILEIAEVNDIAIGAFNVCELEGAQAVIEAAEQLGQPVIVQFAPVHSQYISFDLMGQILVMMADQAQIPVCVHLDHCDDFDLIRKALDMGFSSVMFDGSTMSFEKNCAYTNMAVELAAAYGASVEGELGSMNSEGGIAARTCFTDPDQAKEFVDRTKIDALACSFGTVHGLYTDKPNLDFERIEAIRHAARIPIVMHGGSGISAEDFRHSIRSGVRKINYYTYRAKVGGEYVKKKCMETNEPVFFHDIACWGRESMKEDVLQAMRIFSHENETGKKGKV